MQKCRRCNYEWDSFIENPAVCARCKSYSWRIPYLFKKSAVLKRSNAPILQPSEKPMEEKTFSYAGHDGEILIEADGRFRIRCRTCKSQTPPTKTLAAAKKFFGEHTEAASVSTIPPGTPVGELKELIFTSRRVSGGFLFFCPLCRRNWHDTPCKSEGFREQWCRNHLIKEHPEAKDIPIKIIEKGETI